MVQACVVHEQISNHPSICLLEGVQHAALPFPQYVKLSIRFVYAPFNFLISYATLYLLSSHRCGKDKFQTQLNPAVHLTASLHCPWLHEHSRAAARCFSSTVSL